MPKPLPPVHFEYRAVAGVPLLVARSADAALGTLLWYHGFGVDKEANRTELERFARAGFLAIGVDVAGHGERRASDLDERMRGSQQEALSSVIEFATETANEVPALYDRLFAEGVARAGAFCVAGISMGAFVVYRALIEEPRISAAVAILGSPEWPGGLSPHRRVSALCNAQLLSITAECDVHVPPAPARRFHEQLRMRCPSMRQRYFEIPGAIHLMDGEDWESVMNATVGWLAEPRKHAHG